MSEALALSPRRRMVGRILQQQGALIALIALVAFGALRYGSNFATGFNVQSVLAGDAKYALIALGMTFVIMAGGIDLSVGSVAALGGVVAVDLSSHGLVPSFAAAVAVGALVGVANGILVARYKLAPFLVTLATLLIARGLALHLADARSAVASADGSFQSFGSWNLLGIPIAFWIVALLFAVSALALRGTNFGRNVLAVGGNEDAARLMGLPVERTQVLGLHALRCPSRNGGRVPRGTVRVGRHGRRAGLGADRHRRGSRRRHSAHRRSRLRVGHLGRRRTAPADLQSSSSSRTVAAPSRSAPTGSQSSAEASFSPSSSSRSV